MTLSSSTSRNDYIGNGVTDTYPYTFKIFTEQDLLVTVRDTSGVETTLSYPTDYAVTGTRSPSGGDVILVAGFLASGYAITIRRVRTATQTTDIRNQGAFFPEIHEDAFDHQVMLIQQQEDDLARAIKLPETEAGTPGGTTLPAADQRASKLLGFDGSGNPTALSVIPTGSISASAFGLSLVDDANATEARTTLGFSGSGATVGTADIDTAAVTAIKLAINSVEEAKIAAGAVITTKIDDGAVTTVKIDNSAVTTVKINDSAVTTAKINDGSVTAAKIAAGAVADSNRTPSDGWIPVTDTLTYASSTTFTVSGDKRSVFRFGSRIKLTQTTDKYFYVKNASYSTSTTVTVTAGSDYSLANAAITSPYISYEDGPYGFPVYFNYSPTESGWSSLSTNTCWFKVSTGGMVTYKINVSGTSDTTGASLSFPIKIESSSITNFHVTGTDNSVIQTSPSLASVNGLSSGSLDFSKTLAGGATSWTASGTKAIVGVLFYPGVLG